MYVNQRPTHLQCMSYTRTKCEYGLIQEGIQMTRQSRRAPLTKDKIISEALTLIEKHGVESFSMRMLAGRLRVQPMSLYHHFSNRLDLLNHVLDHVFGDFQSLGSRSTWEERLKLAAREWRRVAQTYPKFYPFIASHQFNTELTLGILQSILQIFLSAGIPAQRSAQYFRLFSFLLIGGGLVEATTLSKGVAATKPLSPTELGLRFPQVQKLNDYFEFRGLGGIFDLGFENLISAIRREKTNAISAHGEFSHSAELPYTPIF